MYSRLNVNNNITISGVGTSIFNKTLASSSSIFRAAQPRLSRPLIAKLYHKLPQTSYYVLFSNKEICIKIS